MSTKAGRKDDSRMDMGEGQERADEGAHGLDYGRMKDEAAHLVGDVQNVWNEVSERLDIEGRIERNPLGTVLAAAGVGFVLGGGIFRPLAARAIGMGLRFALLPLLKDQL